jgi:hypothetical protein
MKSVARGERAPRLEEPPLTDGAWKLIQDCWMQEKTTRPAIEEIVERMIMQTSELIGNNSNISSTPAELVSSLVQSTRLPESPEKEDRITRMRSLTSKKPYDRPEAVIPEHDLRMRSARLASSTASYPPMMVNNPLFNHDSEVVMRERRRKKLRQHHCPFTGCHANFTALQNLYCLSS